MLLREATLARPTAPGRYYLRSPWLGTSVAQNLSIQAIAVSALVGTTHYAKYVARPMNVFVTTITPAKINEVSKLGKESTLMREFMGTLRIFRRRLCVVRSNADYRHDLMKNMGYSLWFYWACCYCAMYLRCCAEDPVAYVMYYTNVGLDFLARPLSPLVRVLEPLFVSVPAKISEPLQELCSTIWQVDQSVAINAYASTAYYHAAGMVVRTGILLTQLARHLITPLEVLKLELEFGVYSIVSLLTAPWCYCAVGLFVGNAPASWYYYGAWLGTYLASGFAGNLAMGLVRRNITRRGEVPSKPPPPIYEDKEIEYFLGLIERDHLECSQEDFRTNGAKWLDLVPEVDEEGPSINHSQDGLETTGTTWNLDDQREVLN